MTVPPDGIVVRPARAEEAEAIGALTEAAYAADGGLDHPGGDAYREVLRDAASRIAEATVLVATRGDDTILATVTIAPAGSRWSSVARPGELEVRMLAVAASARRRGLAQRLVAAVEERGRDLGLEAIVLSTDIDMEPAQRLYERLGYQRRPERDWRIDIDLLVSTEPISTPSLRSGAGRPSRPGRPGP